MGKFGETLAFTGKCWSLLGSFWSWNFNCFFFRYPRYIAYVWLLHHYISSVSIREWLSKPNPEVWYVMHFVCDINTVQTFFFNHYNAKAVPVKLPGEYKCQIRVNPRWHSIMGLNSLKSYLLASKPTIQARLPHKMKSISTIGRYIFNNMS